MKGLARQRKLAEHLDTTIDEGRCGAYNSRNGQVPVAGGKAAGRRPEKGDS